VAKNHPKDDSRVDTRNYAIDFFVFIKKLIRFRGFKKKFGELATMLKCRSENAVEVHLLKRDSHDAPPGSD